MKILNRLICIALALAFCVWFIAPEAHANLPYRAAHPPDTAPLETLLNADGTINLSTGFNGSLDLSGWNMALAADGTPHFSQARPGDGTNRAPAPNRPALADDAFWDGRFDSPPGANGIGVTTLALDGTDLYVGGFMTTTGSLSVNFVARWSPANGWSALGNGLNDAVESLVVSGNAVYAGGLFTQVCGNPACNFGNTIANHIAEWNGSS